MDASSAMLRRRSHPNWAYAARLLSLMIVVSGVGLALGFAVTSVTDTPHWLDADRSLAEGLHNRTCGTWLWPTALALSVAGWPLFFYVTIGALIVFLLLRRERALIAYFVVTGLTGGIVDTVVKQGINRPRPDLGGCNVGLTGKSFPSGHLMIASLCYGMLLGSAWVTVATWAYSRWREDTGRQPSSVTDGADPEALARLRGRAPSR